MRRTNPSRRAAVLLLTLLVHAGVLWLLMQLRPGAVAPVSPQQRVLVQLIATPRPTAPPPLPARTGPAPRPEPSTLISKPAEALPAPAITAALPAEPTASAAVPEPAASKPWLDPEKTRQAVRQMATQPSIREQAAQASDAPRKLTAGERFGQEVQQAAAGDCLKGEFLGGGMGLLSAPFWALAEARGKCRR
ncbi:MAG: hypothetical protein IV092_02805 [Burkholderiaceae bacterium]|nr:hypothetical protein [Burkholderiaceae bacterium]MBT9500147.1 hypothetical protein [Burkholderiaceae bacterium]